MNAIDKFVQICVEHNLVGDNWEAEWLSFVLKKKISLIINTCIMLLIGTYICSFMETISFLLTFLFLRSRTNGIHAKSYAQCFFLSILCELFFISLPTYISSFFLNLVRDLSVATIFIFAPYRHPLMHLNDTEVKACANDAKIRALILELLALLLSFCDIYDAYLGISLGIIMTAMLLVLAYGNIEEVKYEQ